MGCSNTKPVDRKAPIVLENNSPVAKPPDAELLVPKQISITSPPAALIITETLVITETNVEPHNSETENSSKDIVSNENITKSVKLSTTKHDLEATVHKFKELSFDTISSSTYIQDLLSSGQINSTNLRGLFDIVDDDANQIVNAKEFAEFVQLIEMAVKSVQDSKSVTVNGPISSHTGVVSPPPPRLIPPETETTSNEVRPISTQSSQSHNSTERKVPKRLVHIPISSPNDSSEVASVETSSLKVEPPLTRNALDSSAISTPTNSDNQSSTSSPVVTSLTANNSSRPVVAAGRRAPTKRPVPVVSPKSEVSDTSPFSHMQNGKQSSNASIDTSFTESSPSNRNATKNNIANMLARKNQAGNIYASSNNGREENTATSTVSTQEEDEEEEDDPLVPKPNQKKGFMRLDDSGSSMSSPLRTNSATTMGQGGASAPSPLTKQNSMSANNFYVLDAGQLKYMDHMSKSYKSIELNNVILEVNDDVIDIISTEGEVNTFVASSGDTADDSSNGGGHHLRQNSFGSSMSSPMSPGSKRVSLKVKNSKEAADWKVALTEHMNYNTLRNSAKANKLNSPKTSTQSIQL